MIFFKKSMNPSIESINKIYIKSVKTVIKDMLICSICSWPELYFFLFEPNVNFPPVSGGGNYFYCLKICLRKRVM